jgi:hypothetical protein
VICSGLTLLQIVIAGNTINIFELFKIKLDVVSTTCTVYKAEVMNIIKINYADVILFQSVKIF